MAKIGITINEVLRDFIGQFTYTYKKYIGETHIKEEDVKHFDLLEYFEFKDINELNKFLYVEAALEIFGHADQLHDGIMNHFNHFLMDIKDLTDHKVEIVSMEADKSKPSTLFFLSKLGCKIENIRFVTKHADKWNNVDVLITANPTALESKPAGKISVKVKSSYNQDVKADFEIDSLMDFMKDEALREKILNTKITTYEEIN